MNWLFYKQLFTCLTGAHDSRGCQGPDAQTVHCNGGGPGYHQGKAPVPLAMHPQPPVQPQRKVPQTHIHGAVPSTDSCTDTFQKCVQLIPYYLLIPSMLLCPFTCLLCLPLENMCESNVVTSVFKERRVLSAEPR